MFEPTMLPIAMSGTPRSAASTETRSSGVEVPKPTTVRPIRSGGSAKRNAIAAPPRTSHSPPTKSPARPRTMRR